MDCSNCLTDDYPTEWDKLTMQAKIKNKIFKQNPDSVLAALQDNSPVSNSKVKPKQDSQDGTVWNSLDVEGAD